MAHELQPEIKLEPDASEDTRMRVACFVAALQHNPDVMIAVLRSEVRHADDGTAQGKALAAAETIAWNAVVPIIENRDYYNFGYDHETDGMVRNFVSRNTRGRQTREELARGRLGIFAQRVANYQQAMSTQTEADVVPLPEPSGVSQAPDVQAA